MSAVNIQIAEDPEGVQINMEKLYAKNQLLKRIKAEFIEAGFEPVLKERDIPVSFGLDLLVQMQLHKRATVSVLVGILWRHFESESGDTQTAMQTCADMLLRAAEADLVDWFEEDQRFVVKYLLTEDVQKDVDRFQFPLPMIVEPKKLASNRDTGYLTFSGSVLLNDSHHDDDVVLEHLDRMNSIKISVNPHTVRQMQNKWRNLDKPKDGEVFAEFKKRQDAFFKYDNNSRDILESLFILGNEFHLTHRYDARGRTYCWGYHVNYQGNDWQKAIVELADKEELDVEIDG